MAAKGRGFPQFDKKKTGDHQTKVLAFEWHAEFYESIEPCLPRLPGPSRPVLGYSEDEFHSLALRAALTRKFFYQSDNIRLAEVFTSIEKLTGENERISRTLAGFRENLSMIMSPVASAILATEHGAIESHSNDLMDIILNGLLVHGDIGKGEELRTWDMHTLAQMMWVQWVLPGNTPGRPDFQMPWNLVLSTLGVIRVCRAKKLFQNELPDPYPAVWGWSEDEIDAMNQRIRGLHPFTPPGC